MDGKHIALKAPPNSGSIFYNYKGYHSIILFAVADHNYRFIYLNVGAHGSEGDANIFCNSDFGQDVMADRIDFPGNCQLAGENIPYFFLGDDAFPLCNRIIKPYGGTKRKLTTEETIFNYRLSRASRCVENAFGILSIEWLCLKRQMFCSPHRAQVIVAACCLLHKFLIHKSPFYVSKNMVDTVDLDDNIVDTSFHENVQSIAASSIINSKCMAQRGRQCDVGKMIRDKLKPYVNSPEGAVEWQRRAVFLK